MSETTQQILNSALALPPEERAAVADTLLSSLEPMDSGVEQLWAQEAERRIAEYEAGRTRAIPAEQLLGDLDQP